METVNTENQINLDAVFAIWNTLDESKAWDKANHASRCVQKPDWVMVFGDEDELYAVISMAQCRVLGEWEIPSEVLLDETLDWVDIH